MGGVEGVRKGWGPRDLCNFRKECVSSGVSIKHQEPLTEPRLNAATFTSFLDRLISAFSF